MKHLMHIVFSTVFNMLDFLKWLGLLFKNNVKISQWELTSTSALLIAWTVLAFNFYFLVGSLFGSNFDFDFAPSQKHPV